MAIDTPVLALEYRGVQERADFGFLTGRTGSDRVHRVDPVVDHIEARPSVPAQARQRLRSLASPPELVIAYCSCAALGAHIAALCGARLILIDPEAVTGAIARRDFEILCRKLDRVPPAAEESDAAARHEQWETVLRDSRDRVAAVYGGDQQAFEMVDDVFDRYRGWLRFIDACAAAGPAAVDNEVTVILRKPLTDLAALLARPEQVHLQRIDSQAATLDAPEIQDLVAAAVTSTVLGATAVHRSP